MFGFPRAFTVLGSLVALVSRARADYYIDDTNSTLQYNSNPTAAWGAFSAGETLQLLLPNGTYQNINAYLALDLSMVASFSRYAACHTSDNCVLNIPFTGSGIDIQVLQQGQAGINATAAIDSGSSVNKALVAASAPAFTNANVTMFSFQGLTTGSHTLTLTVLDMQGSISGMMFDYAYVNETLVAKDSTSTSASSSPTATGGGSAGSKKSNAGPIVAGVIGGLAAIGAVVFALFYLRRRRRSQPPYHYDGIDAPNPAQAHYDPGPPNMRAQAAGGHLPSTIQRSNVASNPMASAAAVAMATVAAHPMLPEPSSPTPSTQNYSQYAQAAPQSTPNVANSGSIRSDGRYGGTSAHTPSDIQPTVRSGPFSDAHSTSDALSTSSPSQAGSSVAFPLDRKHPRGPLPEVIQPAAAAAESSHDASQQRMDTMAQSLTDEQADFIHSLYQQNVPAPAIARLMERMVANPNARVSDWVHETGLARSGTVHSQAPPSYEYQVSS
ncbi:hypothetical protein CONPUDRAFT_162673 [Coniophora puteana RWD-64-598 SS2]|uniref:Uncharacterized protein n=1 Tax=Coniophora puteana (strain RWD-64-598) TaxID=741705 RepID=A0A5M3N2I4_CONPW|nr:uncharacterized protein CONPUDRAFT_162673 [Coniophora puteana RWD-64-598 SS2]EIW85487.1 hypothetical protein CONPUDRAFT_162673 [Coniophora puteana RWD-64-598 SS2]